MVVAVVVTAGLTFVPKRPPIPASRPMKSRRRRRRALRRAQYGEFPRQEHPDRGGGDPALDWTINLAPMAKSLTLVHRPRRLRQPTAHSVNRCASWRPRARSKFPCRQRQGAAGEPGKLSADLVRRRRANGSTKFHAFLPFFGSPSSWAHRGFGAPPAREFDPPWTRRQFESQTPEFFAIGDIDPIPAS